MSDKVGSYEPLKPDELLLALQRRSGAGGAIGVGRRPPVGRRGRPRLPLRPGVGNSPALGRLGSHTSNPAPGSPRGGGRSRTLCDMALGGGRGIRTPGGLAAPAVFKTGRDVSKSAAQGRRELSRNRDRASGCRCVPSGVVANWGMKWGTPRRMRTRRAGESTHQTRRLHLRLVVLTQKPTQFRIMDLPSNSSSVVR